MLLSILCFRLMTLNLFKLITIHRTFKLHLCQSICVKKDPFVCNSCNITSKYYFFQSLHFKIDHHLIENFHNFLTESREKKFQRTMNKFIQLRKFFFLLFYFSLHNFHFHYFKSVNERIIRTPKLLIY